MKQPLWLLVLLLILSLTWAARRAAAMPWIQQKWIATYPEVCTPLLQAAFDCSLCHDYLPNGKLLDLDKHGNRYAMDIVASGFDIKAAEALDSDRDGRTNGEEILVDCTDPADSRSVLPTSPVTWSVLKSKFH